MANSIHRRGFMLALAAASFLVGQMRVFGRAPAEAAEAQRWTCTNQDCDPFIYDPRLGAENINDPDHPIPPGVAFDDLPEDWICPVCGDIKSQFLPLSR